MTQSTAANNMLYRRALRYELLEDRRLLAHVTVDTVADTVALNDGLTSLREAIFATNLVKGPDTILLSFELGDGGPVSLKLTLGELRITDDLTISSRAGFHTIDASGSDPTPDQNNGDGSRVFVIDDANDNSSINVELGGVVVTGGDVRGDGGAILNRENLWLLDTDVKGNSAVSNDTAILSKGGAIAHSAGQLRVNRSVIADNSGDFGGGIHVEGGSVVIDRNIIATNSSVSGSGIYIAAGDAEITRSWIHGNSAGAFSLGGGIYNAGNLRIEGTTISGNSASFGAGVFNRTDAGEALRITNSTISGNTAFDRGGGIRNAAGLTTIEHSTITSNQAPPGDGGGVASRGYANTRTEIGHTIISGNANSDVDFVTGDINTFASLGYNLIGTGNAVAKFAAAGDRTAIADAKLGPPANSGLPILPDGKTLPTHALLPGSPAINAGDLNAKAGVDGVPLYDQRGELFPRIVNGRIDIGAYEFQEPSDLTLLVDTLTDESDGDFSLGDLSLREAIELANMWPSTDTIRFAPSLSASGPATILLKHGELKITDDVTIEGPGAELLTIDASGNDPTPDLNKGDGSQVFNVADDDINSFVNVSIRGLTLTGGDVPENGGAIRSVEKLTLLECSVQNNAAVTGGGGVSAFRGELLIHGSKLHGNTVSRSIGGDGGALSLNRAKLQLIASMVTGNITSGLGGGISVRYGQADIKECSISNNRSTGNGGAGLNLISTTVRVEKSTISGNLTAGIGGGVLAYRSHLTVESSTISGNESGYGGGGIWHGPAGDLTIRHTTITDNTTAPSANGGGGIRTLAGATASLDHTIVIGNHDLNGRSPDIAGVINSRYSLIGFGANYLGPLADNGGPTMTHALLPGNPAVNAGDPAAIAGMGDVPLYDQRGMPFARVYGARIDIGAFEAQPNPLLGDYNFDRAVDTADYVLWRNTVNSTSDLRADGNGDGVVNDADRLVWRANFGRTAPSAARALSHELLAVESAPKPPALPGGDAQVMPELWIDSSAASRRRGVGSRLLEPIAAASDRYRDESLLTAIAMRQMTKEQRAEYLPQPRNRQSATAQDSSNAQAAVLDFVFAAIGETL